MAIGSTSSLMKVERLKDNRQPLKQGRCFTNISGCSTQHPTQFTDRKSMSVYRTISEIFSVKNGVTLKPGVEVIQGN